MTTLPPLTRLPNGEVHSDFLQVTGKRKGEQWTGIAYYQHVTWHIHGDTPQEGFWEDSCGMRITDVTNWQRLT